MNRKLIALAMAGALYAPAAAMADNSTVTLTGVVHGSIDFLETEDDDGNKVVKRQAAIGSNATRFQIDGKEELGGGLAAIFSLAFDQNFASSPCNADGQGDPCPGGVKTGNLFNRNSFIGLTGGWGTLKIGQNEHVYEIQQILQDPDPASEVPFNALTLMTRYGFMGSGTSGFTRRDPHSIWYASPRFGGVAIEVAYITPAGRKSDVTDLSPQGVVFGADGTWGIVSVYGAFARYDDTNLTRFAVGNSQSEDTAVRLGVGLTFGAFRLDIAGEQLKGEVDDSDILTLGDQELELKRRHFYVAGQANFGPHHIRAAVSVAGKAKIDGDSVDDSEAKNFFLGYGYSVSKRTEFQVVVGKTDNELNSSYNTGAGCVGCDVDGLSFGIRHSF